MRMNAETMKRNGVIYAVAGEMLSSGIEHSASVENIALVSGYSTRETERALTSLSKQNVLDVSLGMVTAIRPFPKC